MSSETASAANYKARKEAFVSNLSGSTLTDINLVTLVASSAVLLWSVLKRRGLLSGNLVLNYAVDFLLNVCGILFAFTIYSSVPILLNLLLIIPGAILGLSAALEPPKKRTTRSRTSDETQHVSDENADTIEVSPSSTKRKSTRPQKSTPVSKTSPAVDGKRNQESGAAIQLVNRPFLTNYRGSMLIATIIGILAVDFPIFPRRFAKVETWGTSLMDLGVGSFVFSAGVVSARSVLRASTQFVIDKNGRKDWELSQNTAIFGRRLLQAFRHSLPLLVLGIVRLISVKNLDYAEHVTEYGVHWNFFFTLALLPPFVELADSMTGRGVRRKQFIYTVIALVVAITYELVLDNTSLLSFILISPRTPSSNLLAKNREGVFSFLGYLSIFLLGRALGMRLCRYVPPSSPKFRSDRIRDPDINPWRISIEKQTDLHWMLGLTSMLFWVLYWTFTNAYVFNFGLIVSRRLANLPYVLWIAAFNHSQLLLFEILEGFGPEFWYLSSKPSSFTAVRDQQGGEKRHGPEVATSQIMRSFNKNGLAVFLVANLLTGLVNLTVNTLDMPALHAMGVLVVYAAAVTGVAVGLDLAGLQIKL